MRKSQKRGPLCWKLQVILLRLKLGLQEVRRDRGALIAIMTIFFGVGYFAFNQHRNRKTSQEMRPQDEDYSTIMLFGTFLGSVLGSGNRLSIMAFLNERKSKMMSFLQRAGMAKGLYYTYHLIWNTLMIFILINPMLFCFDYVVIGKVGLDSVMLASIVSQSLAVFNLTVAILFTNEVTGLNVITIVNLLGSMVGAFVKDANLFTQVMKMLLPQNMIIQYYKQKLEDRGKYLEEGTSILLGKETAIFAVSQLLSLLLILYVLEKFVANEYGTRTKSFLESLASVFCLEWRLPRKMIRVGRDNGNGGSIEDDRGARDLEMMSFSGHDHAEDTVLEIRNLQKEFGSNEVLKGVNLDLYKGETLCLLGCNGAGKSTLFNVLLGNIQSNGGTVTSGQESDEEEISYCPQHDLFWDYFTVEEHFQFVGLLRREKLKQEFGVSTQRDMLELSQQLDSQDEEQPSTSTEVSRDRLTLDPLNTDRKDYIQKIKSLCLLEDHWTVQANKLSGGYKRRLSLALTLLCNSDVLMLDEPTTALDIESRRTIMESIRAAQKQLGKTVLFTTHHLEDAETFADRVAILKNGKISLEGTVEELTSSLDSLQININKISGEKESKKIEDFFNGLKQVEAIFFDEDSIIKSNDLSKMSIWISKGENFDKEKKLKNLIENLENLTSQETRINIKRRSIEDVFLSQYAEETELNSEDVDSSTFQDTWKDLILTQRKTSFLGQTITLLKKNFSIVFRDPKILSNQFIIATLPFIITVIFKQTIGMAISEIQNSKTKKFTFDVSGLIQTYWYVFAITSVYMSVMLQFSSGIAIKVKELESKIRHFLLTAGGSRYAYLLSFFLQDIFLMTPIIFLVTIVNCLIWSGSGLEEALTSNLPFILKLTLLLTLQVCGNQYSSGYPISMTFNTFSQLLTSFNIIQISVVGIRVFLVYLSLDFPEETWYTILLNYVSLHRISVNAIVSITPFGEEFVMFKNMRDQNIRRHGDFWFCICLLGLHYLVYYLIAVWMDGYRFNYHLKKNGTPQDLSSDQENANFTIRNVDEIDNEERSVTSKIRGMNSRQNILMHNVCKSYKGRNYPAVHNLSLEVSTGQVVGLLGPNGAGKSSLLDILCGTRSKTSGDILLGGERLEKQSFVNFAFCLQSNYLWDHLTFEEHIKIIGEWRGLKKSLVKQLSNDLSLALDVGKNVKVKAINLSGGNKRKLNSAIALLSSPQFFVLDEPTAGIDPSSRRFFWNLINSYKKYAAVLLTTHTAREAEALSDKIALVLNGQLVRVGTLEEIKEDGFIANLTFRSQNLRISEEVEKEVVRILDEEVPEVDYSVIISSRNRLSLKLEKGTDFQRLSQVIGFFENICEELRGKVGCKVDSFVTMMNLEQAFLGYASHQISDLEETRQFEENRLLVLSTSKIILKIFNQGNMGLWKDRLIDQFGFSIFG